MRRYARSSPKLDPDLHPDVVVGEEGWWQACPELSLSGYDPLAETGSNLNLILDDRLLDPVSGAVPLRGRPCFALMGRGFTAAT